MLNFKNDYCNLCHKEVFEYLQKYQNETFVGYGTDEITKKAKELIKETIKLENEHRHFLI